MRRLTTEEFIEKAKAIHTDRYDYSQVKYSATHNKVTIVCPNHGPFEQTPHNHLSKKGCSDCGGSNPHTTESFIEKAKAMHGGRYDYSSVDYVNARTNVAIICPDHGPFEQTPTMHLSRQGCPECGGSKPRTTDTFIEKANEIHGGRYDYSRVKYVNSKSPVTIICTDHGPFEQIPSDHINHESGCLVCGQITNAMALRLTAEEFIEKANATHGDRYDYSSVHYVNYKSPVTIICTDHGPFEQPPQNHLSKKGCPACGGTKKLNTETFIERAKAIHDDRYDYSSVDYVNAHTNVVIICRAHGPFEQTPSGHLNRVGCPACADFADRGFNPNKPGLLYYLAVTTDDGDTRYKIGITNQEVEDRFRGADMGRIRTVKTWRYAIGRAAAEREAEILSRYAGDKYCGPDILRSGNSELFTHDILGLDK